MARDRYAIEVLTYCTFPLCISASIYTFLLKIFVLDGNTSYLGSYLDIFMTLISLCETIRTNIERFSTDKLTNFKLRYDIKERETSD